MQSNVKSKRLLIPLLCLLGVAASATVSAAELDLIGAVRQGDAPAIRELIRKKADVNHARGDGMSPLHWAVDGGDPEIAGILKISEANARQLGCRARKHVAAVASTGRFVQ